VTQVHPAGPATARLAHDLASPDAVVVDELATWLAAEPRFRAFAEANRDKIRKKLRGSASDAEARRDVRLELDVIRSLLTDRKVSVAFEPYGSGHVGPDLAVTLGSGMANLEITRRRGAPPDPTTLAQLILAKLRQLPPSVPNALLVASDAASAAELDVSAAIRLLRGRADAKDESFFAARGFPTSRAFYDRFLRLGGVIAWSERASALPRAVLWTNASARIALPPKLARAMVTALSTAG
jgi:hypothetical protein